MLDSQVGELFGIFEIVFQEIEERDVVRGHSHHDLVFLFESLEALDSCFDLLVLDVVDGFTDFHLTFDLGEGCCLQCLNDILIPGNNVVLDEGGDQFRGL